MTDTDDHCLNDETLYKLLDNSVGTIALDCGYHLAQRSSLDVLAEVCGDYIRRITSLLRIAVDTEEWRDSECDFVDPLERVFHQVNIPSAVNLHQFVCKIEAIRKHRPTSTITTTNSRTPNTTATTTNTTPISNTDN